MAVLQVKNLTKVFRSRSFKGLRWKLNEVRAVEELSFEVKEGEIVGLLGPNGAGKTTTIQMLLGCLTPTGGEIFYFGKRFWGKDPAVMKRLNFMSGYSRLPWKMTVRENLEIYARLYEVKKREKRIKKLLGAFGVGELIDKPMYQLSSGQITRVLLAKAFVNYPRMLLLDEPTASLDPDIAARVREFLVKQQKEYGVTMLFTSHNMKEVEEICDRVVFLYKGKKVVEDTPVGLASRIKEIKLRMLVLKGREVAERYLQAKQIAFRWKKNRLTIRVVDEQIPKVLYRFSQLGVRYKEIEVIRPSLEDFFLALSREKNL